MRLLQVTEFPTRAYIADCQHLVQALYCFEWLTTLDQEVNQIWARKWTLSTWIFVANRHGSLILAVELWFPTTSYTVCTIMISRYVMHTIDYCHRGLHSVIVTNILLTISSCVWVIQVGNTLILLQFMITACTSLR